MRMWSTEWHLRYLATDWIQSRVRWEVVKQEVFRGGVIFWILTFLESSDMDPRS